MVFGNRRPSLSSRARNVDSSSCQRAKVTVTGPLAGMGSSSPRCRQSSTPRLPSSARSIKRLFERRLANAAIGFGEALAVLAQLQINIDQRVDRAGHVVALDRRAGGGVGR